MSEIKINRVVLQSERIVKRTAVVTVYEGCGDSRKVEVEVAVDLDEYYFEEQGPDDIDWEEWERDAEKTAAHQENVNLNDVEFSEWVG